MVTPDWTQTLGLRDLNFPLNRYEALRPVTVALASYYEQGAGRFIQSW